MSFWKSVLLTQLFIFSAASYAKLPACKTYGNAPAQVALDKKSGLIVFFDQGSGQGELFQVWDLHKKKKIKDGQLPESNNVILGFSDSKTIVFARTYNPLTDRSTFGPIYYYHLDTDKMDEVPVSMDLRLMAYSLSSGMAMGYARDYHPFSIDLKTGALTFIDRDVSGWEYFENGFSQDGLSYYGLKKANKDYDTKRLSILLWSGPRFFDSDPKVITYIEPEDVGVDGTSDFKFFEGNKGVSESGKSFVFTLTALKQTPNGEKRTEKLLWLDLPTGQKASCDVKHEGIPSVQVVDEKAKTLLLQSDASFYHFRTLVNMNTCQTSKLPQMHGVNTDRSGKLISLPNQNLYYNTGGVWDLNNGVPVIQSCE